MFSGGFKIKNLSDVGLGCTKYLRNLFIISMGCVGFISKISKENRFVVHVNFSSPLAILFVPINTLKMATRRVSVGCFVFASLELIELAANNVKIFAAAIRSLVVYVVTPNPWAFNSHDKTVHVNYPPAKDGWASWFSELGLQLTRGMFRRTSMVPFVEVKLSPGVDSLGSLAILCLNCLNFLVRVWDLFCNSLIIPLIQCWDFTLKQTASRTAYPVVKERLFVIIRDMFGLNLWACRRFIPAAKDRRAFSPKQNGRILSFSWFSVTPWTNFRKGKEDA